MTTTTKSKVTQTEFQKQVDIETANLVYFDRLPKGVAVEKAREYANSRYQIES